MFWRILVIALMVAAAAGLMVQHTVTDSELVTAAQVKASRFSQGAVSLKGTITYVSDDNTFILEDGTGKVELSTCPVWYKRIVLHQGDEVRVIGEVMRNPSLRTKSDFVLSVYKIFKDGDVIPVRRRPGKPPWSSHRLPESGNGY